MGGLLLNWSRNDGTGLEGKNGKRYYFSNSNISGQSSSPIPIPMDNFFVHLKMGWRTGQELTNLIKWSYKSKRNNKAGYYVYQK